MTTYEVILAILCVLVLLAIVRVAWIRRHFWRSREW